MTPLPLDLAWLYDEIEQELAARGAALRNARLRAAAQSPGELPSQIVFDGFFSFSNAELNLIESLAARARIVVALPEGPGGNASDWPGASAARSRLLRAGFVEFRCAHVFRTPQVEAFCAATLEQETEEIARRVLEEVARGRPFHEIGIVLRTRDPYAPHPPDHASRDLDSRAPLFRGGADRASSHRFPGRRRTRSAQWMGSRRAAPSGPDAGFRRRRDTRRGSFRF